jgi:molybdopterin converting factor small subunit
VIVVVHVDFYALLRPLSGSGSITFDFPESVTTRMLLSSVLDKFPAMRSHLLDEHGQIRTDVPIFVNGRNPRLSAAGLDEPLLPESVVSIFSPIASGRMNVEGLSAPSSGEIGDER